MPAGITTRMARVGVRAYNGGLG